MVLLELKSGDTTPPHLAISTRAAANSEDQHLKQRVLDELERSAEPLTQDALRNTLRVRMQRVVHAVRALHAEDRIQRAANGWKLAS